MTSDDFLVALVEPLCAGGLEAKFDGLYLQVAGCKFDATVTKQATKTKSARVRFLDSGFKIEEDTEGNIQFDVARAIGLLLASLPGKIAEKAATVKLADNTIWVRNKGGTCVSEHGYFQWYQVQNNVMLRPTTAGVEVMVRCTSTEEAEELLKSLMPVQ